MKRSWKDCTYEEMCRMDRDHFDVGDFSIMTDTLTVWLSEQRIGERQKQSISIPRSTFDRLVRAYLLQRTVRPK